MKKVRCNICKELGHFGSRCPSNPHTNHRCNECNNFGHLENTCTKKSQNTNQQHNNQTRSTNQIRLEDDFNSWVLQVDCNNSEVPRKKVIINVVCCSRSITVKALADTGATTCVISDEVWQQIGYGKPPWVRAMRLRAAQPECSG